MSKASAELRAIADAAYSALNSDDLDAFLATAGDDSYGVFENLGDC